MSTPGDFPEDEEPTRPDGMQHRAQRLLKCWNECCPTDRAAIERYAELLASRPRVRAIIEQRAPLLKPDTR